MSQSDFSAESASTAVPPPVDAVPPAGAAPLSYAPPAGSTTEPDKDARTWGMLAHLSALAGALVPFGSILGPLVVWLVKRDQSPFVADQAKESLNFQITMAIAFVIGVILIFVVIGFLVLPVLAIVDLVFIIVAAMKANEGKAYRYPFALRLVK